MSRATPRVSDKAARGIRDSWVLSLPGWLLSPPRPSGSRGRSRAGWRRPGGGPWRPRIPEPPAQRAWCPVARPGRDCELFGGAGHVLGRDSSLGPASCCQSRCLGTWSGLRPRDFPKIRRFLAAAVAARFKSSSPRIPGEWGRRGRARGSGPRAALCSPPTPPALFFVSPFHHFCTSRFSFFQPLRSRRLRAILGLWEAPQETGFCPVVGPALLKARLRRRQKCGVRGGESQPWPGAFATLSPSRVSPSVTRRNSLCLQKPDEKGLCKVSFQALSSPLSASLLSTWLFRLLALLHLGPLYKFLAGTDCLSRPVSEPT